MSKDKKTKKELKELRKKYKQLQAESNVDALRPVGDIMLDMEVLLEELVGPNDLQYYEVLNLVFGWLVVHAPHAKERYVDGTSPIFYYGPREDLK